MARSPVRALFLGATLLLSGCLFPAPIEEEEVLPNYPPTFPVAQVTPPFEQEIVYDPQVSTEPIYFEIPGIKDVDAADRIYWRWFINYDARFAPYIVAENTNGLPTSGAGADITFFVSPCDELSPDERTLHRVEVVVSDRPFLTGSQDLAATRNRTLPAGAGEFRLVWYISVDLTACPSLP